MSNNEKRVKLKPNLSNVNYEASCSNNIPEKSRTQPKKRISVDTIDKICSAKRQCHGLSPPTPTKNFAQDRLNKLRYALHVDVMTRVKTTSPEESKFHDSKNKPEVLNQKDNEKAEINVCEGSTTSSSLKNNENHKRKANDSCDQVTSKKFILDQGCKTYSINVESKETTKKQEFNDESKEQYLCIVVDTNVFISDLSIIRNIIELTNTGPIQPLVYIPWMVITELDEIKDRPGKTSLKCQALKAIKCINEFISKKDPRIKGQTVSEMSDQKHVGLSQDDKIIGTCLQAVEKYEIVILLSNDINLRNKAMINDILAMSSKEVIGKIKCIIKTSKNMKSVKIMEKLSILCSEVICECAKNAYGDVWLKMDMLSEPPWSFFECLKRFQKYWTAVFQDKLMKQFKCTVEKLFQLLNSGKDFCDEADAYKEFVKLCLDLCIFLQDLENFRVSSSNVINEITKSNSRIINS
ncbi:transcriptional protein SWT1-like [Diabrotica virgifera virgifera]|uniref:Transcriptional protein SWT1-like n=1 Tax=Diabrotica virgifera virgifera TaxID=50390 RepID=A0A6P7FI97_DIAVI|nr:transcriptional protein SWT1-like [Diabrotica virgifera virgifera]